VTYVQETNYKTPKRKHKSKARFATIFFDVMLKAQTNRTLLKLTAFMIKEHYQKRKQNLPHMTKYVQFMYLRSCNNSYNKVKRQTIKCR
jgi:hypothetical protein